MQRRAGCERWLIPSTIQLEAISYRPGLSVKSAARVKALAASRNTTNNLIAFTFGLPLHFVLAPALGCRRWCLIATRRRTLFQQALEKAAERIMVLQV